MKACVTFSTFNNNKPWFTAKLRQLRHAKEEAYRSGDRIIYKQARNTLTKVFRVAKISYTEKLKNRFSPNDPAGHHLLQENLPPDYRELSTS